MANTTWSGTDKTVGITLTGSNLIATNNNNLVAGVRAIDSHAAGKFYWEYLCNTNTFSGNGVGIADSTANLTAALTAITPACGVRQATGLIYVNALSVGIVLGAITSGTLVAVALDCSARLIWFRVGAAGNWNNSGTANPATGAGGVALTGGLAGSVPLYPWVCPCSTNNQMTANFGNSAFTGAVPGGFTAGFTSGGDVVVTGAQARAVVLA